MLICRFYYIVFLKFNFSVMEPLNFSLDVTKICRLCLSQDHNLTPIHSGTENLESQFSTTASKILACVSIDVELGDNLPDKICNRCIEQLDNWVQFKELCDNANTLLLHCSAGIQSISDEVLQKNLQRTSSEVLDIPESPSNFYFEDVSLLEHDYLLQKFHDSGNSEEGPELLVDNPFSAVLNENNEKIQKASSKDDIIKKQPEEVAVKEANKCKWREKYTRIYQKKYYCDLCQKVFTKFSSLLKHDRLDHKEIEPEEMCLKCGELFISKVRLERHYLLKHKEKIYECGLCEFKSVSEKSLKVHKVKHSDKFVCGVCGAVKTTERSLKDHLRVHSSVRSYCCEICQQTFKQQQSLEHHLKLHNRDLGPHFKCNICLQTFKTINYLKKHKVSHLTDSFIICEICGVVLKNKNTLYIHKLIHNEKKHICMVCDKMFSTKNLLTRHMLIHGDRPYNCNICGKSYNRADTLSMHIKTHSTSQLHCCHHCRQSFTLPKYLKRHIERMHNKEP